MRSRSYNLSVFINCPVDKEYRPLFRAAVFAVLECGHYPRCAVEEDDSSEIRLNKILRIIAECRFGVHDLSRTQLDRLTRLPRFNMPLELGLFLGAKHYGRGDHDRKVCLIFERRPHSYETFISDIKGQDIASHRNEPAAMIRSIRNWLGCNSTRKALPGWHAVARDYGRFCRWLPGHCRSRDLRANDLTFGDYVNLVYEWMER